MEIPATLLELIEQFPDEEACWAYLSGSASPGGSSAPGAAAGAPRSWPRAVCGSVAAAASRSP